MDISNAPHLIKIVKAVGDLEKINICEVDNECTVPPFNDSDAFKFVGKNLIKPYKVDRSPMLYPV